MLLFLVSFGSQIFDVFGVFLEFVILVYYNAISIDFYAVMSFICINFCNFHVYKWENAYSGDLNAWGILMNFYLFIKVKKGGGVALVHVYVREYRVSLKAGPLW